MTEDFEAKYLTSQFELLDFKNINGEGVVAKIKARSASAATREQMSDARLN